VLTPRPISQQQTKSLLNFKFFPDSSHLDLVELLEFLRGAGGQDRKLVQGEFVLVIEARDGPSTGIAPRKSPRLSGNRRSIRCSRSGKGIPDVL